MRFLTGKRIIFGVTGLLVVLALAGWFLFGPNPFKHPQMAGAPPGSTIDAGCAAVYELVKTRGFAAPRLIAEDSFKIEKVLYLTGREAKANYNAQPNVQNDSHVCYVLVRGNIDVTGPFSSKTVVYPAGYAFYEPDSLNLLEIGAGKKY